MAKTPIEVKAMKLLDGSDFWMLCVGPCVKDDDWGEEISVSRHEDAERMKVAIERAIREAVEEVENEYGPMVNDLEMQLESSQKQLAFLNRRYQTEHSA